MMEKVYSSKYEDIIGQFVMTDKPNSKFDPKEDAFKDLVMYALKKSFPDFNFRTLTETDEGKADYKEWESVKKAEKSAYRKGNKRILRSQQKRSI